MFCLLGFFYFGGSFGDVRLRDAGDLIAFSLTVIFAICVWAFVARQPRTVARGSHARLMGYLAIWLLPAFALVLPAVVIRFTAIQPFEVAGGSMAPTLKPGQLFFVKKWSYGYSRFSVAPFHGMFPSGRLFDRPPQRGDIVVFRPPHDSGEDYVMRLIGLPGDEIQFIDGRLHINRTPVAKEYLGLRDDACGAFAHAAAPLYRETLDNGVSYEVLECNGDAGEFDNVGPFVVPADHFFMLGDNRDRSQDSRVLSAVGYIPYDHLIGQVLKHQ